MPECEPSPAKGFAVTDRTAEPQLASGFAATHRRPISRQDQIQQTRARLLEAAIELFHTVGYRQTTVDQIVRKAGTSRPTFYAHYRDKIDLANHIGAG